MTTVEYFFIYFAVSMVFLSLLIITVKNPVHSILLMLVLFFHIAGLYLFLNAEFLAAVQVILYAGAILVLFLFVIMMLNLKEELVSHRFIGEWPVGVAIGLSISLFCIFAISHFQIKYEGNMTIEIIKTLTNTKALGKILYTEFLLPFEIASIILLIAIVGAIVLAKKEQS
ncbi:MAG: NADH-quinone oxidoreductase subunit J [Thermodesulfovibrionales bacterium]|nr:NADH-quinone oxidoreductase subunit J [Thermodesulfovibrionales bacterium]